MKICIIPVCYNAQEDALRLLDSIDRAYANCTGLDLTVILADNSTVAPAIEINPGRYLFELRQLKNENTGYFPAFNKALSSLNCQPDSYDFVIVCNVDLVLADDFFASLLAFTVGPETGVLAPGIFSDKDGRDLNPKMMRRPSLAKIQFMRLICSNVVVFQGYHKLVRIRELIRSKSQKPGSINFSSENKSKKSNMYGAHGSFLIFTKRYFLKGANVCYPRFLFGEEGFVAEQLRMNELIIEHAPSLKIFDKEHASTSKVNMKFICSEHKKSYDYFYTNFLKKKA